MSNYDPNNPSEPGTPPPPPPPPEAYPPAPGPQSTYGSAPPAYGAPGPMGSLPPMTPTSAAPVARPPAMDMAVKLMQAGGVVSILSLLLAFTSKSAIRDAVQKQSDKATTHLTPEQIDNAVNVGMTFGIVLGLLGAGLWFWMASANGKGKSWARVVATVFFVLQVLSFLASFLQASTMLARLASLVTVLIGAAAIFFMYKKESTDFYQASKPRVG